jgi:hypothetical protein
MSRPLSSFSSALLVILLAACGQQATATTPDDGGDAAPDGSPPDASPDAALTDASDGSVDDANDGDATRGDDASPDASTDAPSATPDGSADAEPDAEPDAPADAPVDAPVDAPLTPLPLLLASDPTGVFSLDQDATNIYFTTGAGGVNGVPKAGGSTFVVATPSGIDTKGVVHLTDGTLYWDPQGLVTSTNEYDQFLRAIPVTARSAPSALLGSFTRGPNDEVVDFVLSGTTAYSVDSCVSLQALPLVTDGGSPSATPFYTGTCAQPEGEWISPQLDTANGTIDVLDDTTNQIRRISLANGTALAAIPVPPHTTAITIQGSSLYWITFGQCDDTNAPDAGDGGDAGCVLSTLSSSALDGSSVKVVASGAWPVAVPDVFGATSVRLGPITSTYAFLVQGFSVLRITLASGEASVVYSAIDPALTLGITAFAADDTYFYVADESVFNGACDVFRVPN